MKVTKWQMALAVVLLVATFVGGQLVGYLNRRVAEGTRVSSICQNYGRYVREWINDTDGHWVW